MLLYSNNDKVKSSLCNVDTLIRMSKELKSGRSPEDIVREILDLHSYVTPKIDSTEGMTNDTYILNSEVVLRLPGDNTDMIDRSLELSIVGEELVAPYSPDVLYLDETGFGMTEYIPDNHHMSNYDDLDKVIKVLAKLHKTNLSSEMKSKLSIDITDDIESKYKASTYDDLVERTKVIKNLIYRYGVEDLKEPVLVHGDLMPNNMLFVDDGMYLIDWEYAGVTTKYWDLACIITENREHVDSESDLLEFANLVKDTYEDESGEDIDLDKLLIWTAILEHVWVLWSRGKFGEVTEYEISKFEGCSETLKLLDERGVSYEER